MCVKDHPQTLKFLQGFFIKYQCRFKKLLSSQPSLLPMIRNWKSGRKDK